MSVVQPGVPAKGFCQCGCGKRTAIAQQNHGRLGHVKGQPVRFVLGHHSRLGIGGARRGPRRDLAERFWEKVRRGGPNECWSWTGSKFPDGYGSFRLNGRNERAHRLAWLLVNGSLGPDHGWLWPFFQILHTCDTPPCCNPAHLRLGTDPLNKADMVGKGRQARGERHGGTRLTEAKVMEIHRLYQAGIKGRVIARRMGVGPSTVWHIVLGESWRHITQQKESPR